MTPLRVLIAVVSVAATVALEAQTYERVLAPVVVDRVPGALGSVWLSELWVYNGERGTRTLDAHTFCVALCPPRELAAGQTGSVPLFPQRSNVPGLILYVEQPSSAVAFHLRIQDLSRQSQTWGTEIPVVREAEFTSGAIRLLNIPNDSAFRGMLRIYALDGGPEPRVRVNILQVNSGRVLGARDVLLHRDVAPGTDPKYKPLYAEISDLIAVAIDDATQPRFTVEVTPLAPGLKIWAFASITNNTTQHVTTVTAQ